MSALNKFKKEDQPVYFAYNNYNHNSFSNGREVLKLKKDLLVNNEFKLYNKEHEEKVAAETILYCEVSKNESYRYSLNNELTAVDSVEKARVIDNKYYIPGDNVTPKIFKEQYANNVKNKEANSRLIYNLSILFYSLDGYAINYIDEKLFDMNNIYVLDQALRSVILAKVEEKKSNNIALENINRYMSEAEKEYKEIYNYYEHENIAKKDNVEETNNELLR